MKRKLEYDETCPWCLDWLEGRTPEYCQLHHPIGQYQASLVDLKAEIAKAMRPVIAGLRRIDEGLRRALGK